MKTRLFATWMLLHSVMAGAQPVAYDFNGVENRLVTIVSEPETMRNKWDIEIKELIDGSSHDHQALCAIARDSQDPRSSPAIMALSSLGTEWAADILTSIARGTDEVAARNARKSLAGMHTGIAAPRLISLLEDPTMKSNRKVIISYLSQHPCSDTEEALVSAANISEIQTHALSALGLAGTTKSLQLLRHYSEEGVSSTVRSIAKHSIRRIEQRMASCTQRVDPEYENYNHSTANADTLSIDAQAANVNQALELPSNKLPKLSSIEAIGANLAVIERQALQAENVKNAIIVFNDTLQAKLLEYEAQSGLPVLNEQQKEVLKGKALETSEIKQAKEHVREVLLDTMIKINPDTMQMIESLGIHIINYLQTYDFHDPQPLEPEKGSKEVFQ